MTAVTEPHLAAIAAKESDGAAINALPINELGAVPIVVDVPTDAHLFDEAGETDKILAPGVSSMFSSSSQSIRPLK